MRVGAALLWALLSGPVVALLLQGEAAGWRAMLGYQAGCAVAAWAAGGRMGKRPPAVGLLAAAAASAIAAFTVGAVAHRAGIAPQPSPLWRTWGLAPPADLVLLTVYLLLNPGLEEWFWRGTLLGEGVKRRLGRAGAWTLSVGAFLPFHLVFLVRSFGVQHGALFAVGVLGVASFWAALCERHGHAWWSAASHLGADLGVVLLYLRFLRQ